MHPQSRSRPPHDQLDGLVYNRAPFESQRQGAGIGPSPTGQPGDAHEAPNQIKGPRLACLAQYKGNALQQRRRRLTCKATCFFVEHSDRVLKSPFGQLAENSNSPKAGP